VFVAVVLTVLSAIVGDSDQLVPPVHMKKLYDLAVKSSRREMYSVSGGTHNDTWFRAGFAYYQVTLVPFLHLNCTDLNVSVCAVLSH
jgi:hypothetical protein